MKPRALKKTLSVFLSLLMVLGTLSTLGVLTAMAVTDDSPAHPDAYLLGKYFSNSWVWYDAATGQNRLSWKTGEYQSYNDSNGMTHLNNIYLQISTPRLLEGITADTGVTFSYTYTPQLNDNHRHVFSFGANEYSGSGSNADDHFYISATRSWMGGNKFPFVGFVIGSVQTINAYPENGPDFNMGGTYSIVITITKDQGVVFYIDGTEYTAAYYNSSFNDQKTNIETLLNTLQSFQYNYIGVSRWGDGYFTGDFKDLSIYSRAFTKTELDTAPLPTGFAAEALANFDVNQLSTSNAQFTVVPAHQGDPMTDAYSNYVYAGWTAWSGDGFNDVGWAIGRTTFKVAVPGDNVLVYDGVHDVVAPITLESWSNDTSGQSQIIKYVADNADQFDLKQNWQGYSSTWNVWAKNNIATAESFSHLRDTDPESPATQRDGASRFWWNMLLYTGSGNTLTYYSADYNITYHARTAYRNSASTNHSFREDDMTSNSHYYVINYQPIYAILSDAAAFYNTNIAGQEWKYTDESLNQAMSALYLIQLSNPNHYTYENVKGDVQKCASAIKLALREYTQIQLVKKTGTVTFKKDTGELYAEITKDYGDTVTVPAVPAKESTAQYNYINGVWTPAVSDFVMNDDYNGAVYTASYTQQLRSYTITWTYYTDDGIQNATTSVNYGETPTPPESATNGYQTVDKVYTFTGWDQTVVPVAGTATYTAQYSNVPRTYTVRFFGTDGQQIGNSQTVAYGNPATPETLPEKPYDDVYHYTFTWDKAFDNITQDTDVTAVEAAVPHTYSYTSNHNGTCVANGTQTGVCSCGKTVTVEEPDSTIASIHPADALEPREAVPATCSAGGFTEGVYCTACNNWASGHTPTAIDETAHSFTYYESVDDTYHNVLCAYNHSHFNGTQQHDYVVDTERSYAATCTADGLRVEVCSLCSHEKSTVLTAGGHAWGDWANNGNGTHSRTCANAWCAADEKTQTEAHTWDDGTPISTATCMQQESTLFACTKCDATDTVTGDFGDHTPVFVPAVTPTCVAAGNTAYYRCSTCDKYFEDEACTAEITDKTSVAVPADTVNGHAYGDFTSDGNGVTHTKRCTRTGCAEANAENGYAVSENCSGGDPATCRTKSVCSVCHEAYGTFDETNHENVVDVPAVAANCVTEGFTAGRQCTVCGEFTVEPESLGFDTVNGHVYGDFTSDNNGVTHTKRCTRTGCAEANAENGYAVTEYCSGGDPATCKEKSVCTVCGASYGDYADHVYGEWHEPQAATCCNEGWCGYFQCSVCDKYFDADHNVIEDIVIAIDPDSHVYDFTSPDESASTRPVYDEASGEWSKGTLVYHCLNTAALDPDTGDLTYDTTHDKVIEDLERADYSVFDEETGKIRSITDLDLDPDATVRMLNEDDEYEDVPVSELLDEIGFILDFIDDFPLDMITSDDPAIDEQPMIDEFVEGFDEIIAIFFNTDGTPKEALLNRYTVTFTLKDGTATTYADQLKDAVVNVPEAPAEADGYAFLGWTLDGTSIALASDATEYTVTGDAAFTAKYADTPTNCIVTFLNADGTGLATVTVAYGTSLEETDIPTIPAKEADADNHYIGSWNAAIVTTVTVDATYQVVYTPEAHTGGTATCEEKAACTVCGTIYGDFADHVYGEWVSVQPATCSAAGHVGYYQCSVCNKYFDAEQYEIEDIILAADPDAHSYGAWTKLDDEKHQRVCAYNADHVETEDHDWQQTGSSDGTCLVPGTVSYECSVCDATKTEPGAYGVHQYGEWTEEQAATCSAAGHVGYYYCSVCEKYYDAENDVIDDIEIAIDPDAHSWTWVIDDDPTCGEPGKKHQECTLCGDTQAEDTPIPATGNHTSGEATVENNVAPTCTAGGSYDSVVCCSVCGAERSRTPVTVGALGHDFGDWAETAHPTCTEAGEKQRTCSRCPETETETVPALGHDYTAWATVTPATCTTAGSETRGCTRCDLEETRTVAALGHSWGAWVVITEPTFEANGRRRRDCDRCDAYEEEVLVYSGETNRQIQFVVSGDMHYVVHMRNVDYEIYSRTTPAIYWYDNTALTFDVHTHSGWGTNGVLVSVNGEELKPNADGSYTIPGGTDFVKINAYAVDTAASSENGDVCAYCGKVHPNSLWGRIVAFFHLIFWFFKNLFNK